MSSSLTASLDVASTGLAAVNAQMAVVSQNISNATTVGYVTEQVSQSSQTAGGIGSGVTTGVATRVLDAQLQQDVLGQNGTVSALSTTQTALQAVDAAQGTVAGGNDLGSALSGVQSAFATLQDDPSSTVQQAAVVAAATTLTDKINLLANTYQSTRQNVQDSLVSDVTTLDTALSTVGSLSDQIVSARQRGLSTADLENQRDAALQTVSGLVSVRTLLQPNGDMVVSTTGGLVLPTHGSGLSLADATLGAGASRAQGDVPGVMLNGQDVTAALTGGSIGAGIQLRDTTLPTFQAQLDEFSENLSTRFSAQGLTLFTNQAGTVPASGGTPTQTGYVGYSLAITVNPAVVKTPSLVRDGTDTVAGSSTGASAFTPNTDASDTGFATLIGRVLDYSLGADVQDGVTQPPLATSGLGPDGTLSATGTPSTDLSGAASVLVASQSAVLSNASTALTSEQAVQTTLAGKFSASSAVNTDTELATMVSLQSSYGANAKIFTAVQAMWSALLAAVT